MVKPRVTAIIATYNWAPVLPYAIASVLDQDFDDFELLVVGDGCTDESEDVVTAVGDERVHWHNLDTRTRHQSGPNNEGIRRARGDIIAYLGHDDLWLPDHLRTLVGAIDGGRRVVYTKTLVVAPNGNGTIVPDALVRAGRKTADRTRTVFWVPPTAAAHVRTLTDEVGAWRPLSATEQSVPQNDLWARMAGAGHPPAHVPRVTNVKIDSARRRNVYRRRPHHEQEFWLRLIRDSADAEATMREWEAGWRPEGFARKGDAYQPPGVATRALDRLRKPWNPMPSTSNSAYEHLRVVRRYKGVRD